MSTIELPDVAGMIREACDGMLPSVVDTMETIRQCKPHVDAAEYSKAMRMLEHWRKRLCDMKSECSQ